MKKPIFTALISLGIIGFAIYQYRLSESDKIQQVEAKQIVGWRLVDCKQVQIESGDKEYQFAVRDQWWVIQPVEYPANQENLFGQFEMMSKVLADEAFKTNDLGKYGMNQAKGKVTITHLDGREQILTVGGVEAAGGKLYVLNSLDENVYVVHNAWAQLVSQPVEVFLNTQVFLGQKELKRISVVKGGEKQWQLKKIEGKDWDLLLGANERKVKPRQIFQAWRNLRSVQVSEHQLDKAIDFKPFYEIEVENSEKTMKVSLNQEMNRIYLHDLSTIGKVEAKKVKNVFAVIQQAIARPRRKR